MFSFKLLANDKAARAGEIITPHGSIHTPSFIPVGTLATVKGISVNDLRQIGSQVIIANTYHLHLQPGEDLIEKMGGLHQFMGWDGPLITDSGGFQIFSLGAAKEHGVGKIASIFPDEKNHGGHRRPKNEKSLVQVDEDGVEFISYRNGARHRFTPERVIEIERKLGADIILVLDECTSPFHDYKYTSKAMERTHRWAIRALNEFKRTSFKSQAIFGIIQGGAYQDLREKSAQFISGQDFDGYGIGGSLGKSTKDMHRVLEWAIPSLPSDKPRHLLGIGEIEDIFEVISRGIDLFDCVLPTRLARTGTLFTKEAERFRIHIRNAQYTHDPRPIENGCDCSTCRNFSRAYLRYLFMAKELLAIQLASIHNLYFLESLMHQIRSAIKEKRLAELKKEWFSTT
jgi:queuine tRNA-ribosyltransferase/7-cyano-7-deazaguanine tRNA-ribosyltransferase